MSCFEEAKKIRENLTEWRRTLHQIPEVGITLPQTVKYVAGELEKMGITYEVKEDISCVFAVIGSGSPCILLRADMDGLGTQELSGETFASTNGCSHACGHDMHAAALLGAAKILKEKENDLKGTVKLLFQSGEETFQGASAAIQAGVLENPKVDVAFGMHSFAGYETGHLLWGQMPMAAVYGFKMIITGKGGHGAEPEKAIDSINAGVQVYLALQSLLARECPSSGQASLTIGQFSAGVTANTIPEQAILQGTLRTYDAKLRERLIKRIHEISTAVASAYRCKIEIEKLSDVPSIICDDAFSEICLESVRNNGGVKELHTDLHLGGSEDFAFISGQVPSCYMVSGAGVEDHSRWRGQHNPDIVFNEDSLPINTSVYVQVAIDYLNYASK